ncbi:hypothetical protein FACS1894166_08160 [Bacilli bacterium]|nr:hypothetical protein FACS1894166_08160 [Bacilli bacterium]
MLTFLAKEDILLNKDDTITISATSDNVTKTTSISLENPYLDEIPTNWKIQEKGTMIVGQDILATMTHVEMSNKATHTAMLTRNQKCNYEIYKDEQGVEQLIISGIDKVQKFNGQTVTTEEVAFQMKISDLASTSNMQTVYYQHNFEEFTKNALPFANFNPATPQHTK